jgi:hypothetical protein
MISLYRVAEQAEVIIEKRATVQQLIPAVIDAYAFIAKAQWFEATQFDTQEIDGSFLSVFTDLKAEFDKTRDLYYVTMPSTYMVLPLEIGVNWVSGMKDKESWVRTQSWGKFAGIKAGLMGGRQVYYVEGPKMFFPKMVKADCDFPIIMKLAIAYDDIDPYEKINIAPNIIDDIIRRVAEPYMIKQNPIEKVRPIIN